ncbi:unannotated protein [freshwater metagenome]|uniref:Unannotated protein n=1 Tax=freshwater metagenome TaxID=449393 RepID=A0A6J7HFD4_9ZZZZ|nr:HAD-IA family hydrolase [Actinomycetota bacterium]
MTAPRAILLDALGTLLELDDPVGGLQRELAARGAPVDEAAARGALGAEMAYYRAHCDRAADVPALEELRDRCADVLRRALPPPAAELGHGEVRAALLAALRFRPFPEVPAVLGALRDAGSRLVIVSNWDVSLHGVLRDTGLESRVDAVVTSAQCGVAKPGPAIFRIALERAGGVAPQAALHVGDDPRTDIAGAVAAGIPAVLVDRDGSREAPAQATRVISTLAGLLPSSR